MAPAEALTLEEQRQVTRIIRAMDRKFWVCRSDGHHWQHKRTERMDYDKDIVERELECATCPSRRIDTVNVRSGVVARRIYRPAEGYRLHGYGRRPSAEFRLPLVNAELKGEI